MNITVIFPSIRKVAPTKVLFEIIKNLAATDKTINFRVISLDSTIHDTYLSEFSELAVPVYYARKLGLKGIFKLMNDSQVVHSNGLRPNALVFFYNFLSRKKNKIFTSSCHSVEEEDFVLSRGKFKGILGYKINAMFHRSMDKVFCVSPQIERYALKHNINSVLAPNGIDFSENVDLDKVSQMTLIQVGRFSTIKNQLFTTKVIEHLQLANVDFRLFFAGEYNNAYGEQVRNKLRQNENVTFLGHIDAMTLEKYLQRSDMLLMPSITEGISLSALEGLRYGAFFIGNDIESLRHVAFDINIGCTLELDAKLWSEQIIKNYQKLTLESKHSISKIAKSRFSVDNTAKVYAAIWNVCDD